MRRFIPGLVAFAVLGLLLAAVSIEAETSESDDSIKDQIHRFNLLGHDPALSQVGAGYPRRQAPPADVVRPRSVGSALSPTAGFGVGVSVDQTFDDIQWWRGNGRHIVHWYNGNPGSPEVSVHFAYQQQTDTDVYEWTGRLSGYNVYEATV